MKRPITTEYRKGKKQQRVGRAGTVENALIAASKRIILGIATDAQISNARGVLKATVHREGQYITVLRT